MQVKSESEVTQSCPTLSGPMDLSLPGSSIHGIFQARLLEWGAMEWGAIAFSELTTTPYQRAKATELRLEMEGRAKPREGDTDRS